MAGNNKLPKILRLIHIFKARIYQLKILLINSLSQMLLNNRKTMYLTILKNAIN